MSDKKIVSTSVERTGPDPDGISGLLYPFSHEATAVASDGTVATGKGCNEADALRDATERALREKA